MGTHRLHDRSLKVRQYGPQAASLTLADQRNQVLPATIKQAKRP